MTYDNLYIEDIKYPNGHHLNEIIVTPNGNSIGSISSDAMRDEMYRLLKVGNIKLNRYARDMIRHIHNGTESAAKFLAPIVASPALPHAWTVFNSSAVLFPLTLGGVKSSINDIKKGNISLSTGLGLLPLAKNAKYINGRTLFNNLPYKALKNGRDLSDIVINVLRKPINSNPFKNIFPYLNKRYLASNRPLKGITSKLTYLTTTNNSIGLLKSRIQSKLNNFYLPDNGLDGIPIRNHTSLILSYKDLRSLGSSKTRSLLYSPFYYTRVNMLPGVVVNLRNPFIALNLKAMQSYGFFDKENAIAHELSHILDGKLTFEDAKLGAYKAFNPEPLPKRIGEYFTLKNYTELTARGTLLKNYFGISDDTPLTGDMLKYAASNYVKDTGMNNNMNLMFRSIKDWDKAAAWFNKHSYRNGGKIIDVEGYPLVDSDSEGLTDWFKNNPNVAGMAIGAGLNGISGERRIVLNPNLKDPNARNSVYMNESYRHFFDANNISLPAVTDVQREAYKGTSYEGLDRRIQETEAARYLSGDPSHHLNAKQKAQLNNFRFTYPGRTLPELEVSIEYNSKNQKNKR